MARDMDASGGFNEVALAFPRPVPRDLTEASGFFFHVAADGKSSFPKPMRNS
jgi:hypothetical protein